MTEQQSIVIEEKKFTWDGRIFDDKNKAKTHARRYLRQGFEVHMKNEGGNYFLFAWRAWPFELSQHDSDGTTEVACERL